MQVCPDSFRWISAKYVLTSSYLFHDRRYERHPQSLVLQYLTVHPLDSRS